MNNVLNTQFIVADTERELLQLRQWVVEGKTVALAQVIATWGSSPRPVGSLMVINEYGDFMGSISGGCIEGAVIAEAQEVIVEGAARTLEFGVSQEQAWEVGLSCGGSIHIFIQAISDLRLIDNLLEAWNSKQAIALLTNLTTGEQDLLTTECDQGQLSMDSSTRAAAENSLNKGQNTLLKSNKNSIFVRSFVQPYRLFLIGAVHIAQVLAPMAQIAGFRVTIIDPRAAFATEMRFDGIELIQEWPDNALSLVAVDQQTAVVTLSHDPKIDDPALISALNSQAFYIGALGSKRTHGQRLERLQEQFNYATLGRIQGPVGLNLGGRMPAEIAVAILAQIIQARHQSLTL